MVARVRQPVRRNVTPPLATGVGYITGSTLKVGHLARLFVTIHFYWTTSFPSDTFNLP
jgi:hypothetical protein